jgi:hypothetical protein
VRGTSLAECAADPLNKVRGAELLSEWREVPGEPDSTPATVSRGSKTKAWWKCGPCGHAWSAAVGDRTLRTCDCPRCHGGRVPTLEAWCAANGARGALVSSEFAHAAITTAEVPHNSTLNASWLCVSCDQSFQQRINARTLVVCGGRTSVDGESLSDVWRLDLATMRWEPMPALVTARRLHVCCAVRGALVVLGGFTQGSDLTSSVEKIFSSSEEGGALPPLSCGEFSSSVAVVVDESDSAAEQVLLLGGGDENRSSFLPTVHLVDLATGACAQQPDLLHPRAYIAAGRLADGRIVCAGVGLGALSSAEVWGPLAQGAADAAWSWRGLPAMSVGRYGCCGWVMSDGRFTVLGGSSYTGGQESSCEALVVDSDAH